MVRRMGRSRVCGLVGLALVLWLWWPLGWFTGLFSGLDAESKKPNIILILTDDQDLHMDSLAHMPFLDKHLVQRGTSYNAHYCTVSICCPSRVSLLTGKTAHNTNVTDVSPPYGGYQKFAHQGFNDDYLPIWMQQQGYNTYYTGKLMNGHTIHNYDSPFVKGWTGADFLLDPQTYTYIRSIFQRDREAPKKYFDDYSTDVIAEKTYGFLKDASASRKPFFMVVAPIAPHATFEMGGYSEMKTYAPIPAERHKHLFRDAFIPRAPNFNPDEPTGTDWIKRLRQVGQRTIDEWDEFHRDRLRSLQAVDEMVDGIVRRLSEHDMIDNTYLFYSTDNGYHIGQHRIGPGKECGFEEDIHIPMIVRGPGIPEGLSTSIVTTHTDLAPTFMSLTGAKLRPDFDGLPMPLTLDDLSEEDSQRPETVNIEFWGTAFDELNGAMYANNTYKGVRLMGPDYDFYYSVWCSNSHELYDLKADPYQLNNIYPTDTIGRYHPDTFAPMHGLNVPLPKLIARLDALLFVLKTCKGTTCTQPWRTIHPFGDVANLRDALRPEFDTFYETQQRRVEFAWCALGYLPEAEGPAEAVHHGGGKWDHLIRA